MKRHGNTLLWAGGGLVCVLALDFSLAFGDEFRYDSKGKRDPFLSPAEAALLKSQLGPGELRLEGIILDPKSSSYALLNGEIVREGTTFSGFFLKKVERNRITLEKEGEFFSIILEDEVASSKENQKEAE